MIRFVDLTDAYWTEPGGKPLCGFLSTVTDKFLESLDGEHTFRSTEEVLEHREGQRMLSLVPVGFFLKYKTN